MGVLSLKKLTLKVVLILALVTAGRVSSLVHIDTPNLSIVPGTMMRFLPSKLLKQRIPNFPLKVRLKPSWILGCVQ